MKTTVIAAVVVGLAALSPVTGVSSGGLQSAVDAEQRLDLQGAERVPRGDEVDLTVGRPVSREIKTGDRDIYRVQLNAGDFMHLVVEQRGVDVVVSLQDPSGTKLGDFDGFNGSNGQEPVFFVAKETGEHRVVVSAFDEGAKGTYELRVVARRRATESDRLLADAAMLHVAAISGWSSGERTEAAQLEERVATVFEKVLGPDHLDLAWSLDNLVMMYRLLGNGEKAELFRARTLAIRERVLGPDSVEVATDLYELGFMYGVLHKYDKAEPLLVRALAIREKAFGPDALAIAECLDRIATLRIIQGSIAEAESLVARALAIREKTLGPDDTAVADTLTALAFVYWYQGLYSRGEPLLVRALAIQERKFGPNHARVVYALNQLALFYWGQHAYAKAIPFAQRALDICEATPGLPQRNLGASLTTLAVLYKEQREFAKAEPLLLRALAIREKIDGRESDSVSETLTGLGRLYRDSGQYAKAEPIFARAEEIMERNYGPDHYLVPWGLYDIATLRFAAGNLASAVELMGRAGDAREDDLRRNLVSGSQASKRGYLSKTDFETDVALSVQAACGASDARALRLGLEQVLRRKGRALDALVDQLAVLERAGSPADRVLIQELAAARAHLADITYQASNPDSSGKRRSAIDAAQSRVDVAEAEACARSGRIRAVLAPITLDAVTRAVPADSVLLEFATYHPYDPRAAEYGALRYVAFTLTSDGTIHWADLGDAGNIDAAVGALRAVLRDPNASVERDVKPRARALDALVFAPVRASIGTRRHVLIAPDGQLSLVPFDALIDEGGRYVTETLDVSYLTSGRDLLRLEVRGESRQPAVIIADPDFGRASSSVGTSPDISAVQEASGTRTDTTMAELLRRALFRPLRGTAAEARALKRLLPGSRAITGASATKRELLAVAGPRVLHVATHGFFLAGDQSRPDDGRALVLGSSLSGAIPPGGDPEFEPLLRSGLALAGANLHRGGGGILTSLEAAGLDLWGTKLVVLSACDTGVGEVRNGEGVYGLRRALVLAGSETQVISLWPVSDLGTRELMIGYYKHLVAGEGRAGAMRAMRLELLRYPKYAHPYFWAGFIVSGEWANLNGQRR